MNRLFTTLSLGLFTVGFFVGPCHGGLIAHWTGDNTTVDATGNGHDGAVGSIAYTGGVVGEAFLFDGNDPPILVPADPVLEPANFSISLWVKAAQENHLRVLIDSTHGAGQAGWALQINAANNLSFAYGNGSTFPELVTAAGFDDGEFHHIAATLDGTTMRVYVDGGIPTELAYSGIPAPSGRDIQIGNSLPLNRPFEGSLDDIRIFDHALSLGEVRALASIPEPTTLGLLALAAMGVSSARRCL